MTGGLGGFVRRLCGLAAVKAACGLGDAELLDRWLTARDQAAFEVLVWRHGPLVLGVCRRLLRRTEDVEDAFQATFLTLLRKASSVRNRHVVAGWLYRVAYRIALRARTLSLKQTLQTEPIIEVPVMDGDDVLWRDLKPVLDDEVSRLPEKYRAAFVLCHLQGKTNAAAAEELGCPVGTVLSRLSWARERLRRRLTRRGVTLGASLFAAAAIDEVTAAPPELVRATLSSAAGNISPPVANLTQGVINAMWMSQVRTVTAVVLMVAVAAGGGVWVARQTYADEPVKEKPAAEKPKDNEKPPATNVEPLKDIVRVPSRIDGIILVLGTEIGPNEKIADEDIVTAKLGGVEKKFRRLNPGDRVEAGQLLARLDDRLAQEQLATAKANLKASEGQLEAAVATRKEAEERYRDTRKLAERGVVSKEELVLAQLAVDRCTADMVAKEAVVAANKAKVRQAEIELEMHEIRSRHKGVVQKVRFREGEAVKAFETVLEIRAER